MKMFTTVRKGNAERGSQLLELAFVLPLLLVLIAGATDFAQAWNARQTLTNAARDGARLASEQSPLDLSDTNPPTIQAICQQVADYLVQQNMNPAFMGISGTSGSSVTTGCSSPGTSNPSSAAIPEAFTYYDSGTTYGLKIERGVSVTPSGGTCTSATSATDCVDATRITLTYPYHWSFGFNRVIRFFGPSYPSKIPIQVYSIMPNIAD